MSESLNTTVGSKVGYDLGINKKISEKTEIVFKTDHSLVMEWTEDPLLSKYHCVIVDEAHERSLSTDVLLSILKMTLRDPRRKVPLKIVITSATIDPTAFCNFYQDFSVKLLEVKGKIHPIELFWGDTALQVNTDYVIKSVDKVEELLKKNNADFGTILSFLATPADTARAVELLTRRMDQDDYDILQLHGRLPIEEQEKVFLPINKRRVVFATNAAETSITIPEVTVVVDAGIAKERDYDAARNISILKLREINQSSARQRMGRAGRTRPGQCYRLYTKKDHQSFSASMVPEIKRVPLDQCLLQLISMGITNPKSFEFVESPAKIAIEKGIDSLQYLDAIKSDGNDNLQLTKTGTKMSKFSMDPRLSKMIVLAINEGKLQYLKDIITICAVASNGGNVFYRQGTFAEKQEADMTKLQFCDENSDFVTMLNVYKEWNSQDTEKAKSKWCFENFINGKSMKAIRSTRVDIFAILKHNFGIYVKDLERQQEDLTKAYLDKLMARCFGLHLAKFTGYQRYGYVTVWNQEILQLHPGSSIFHVAENAPKFVVFDQMMITSNSYMLHVHVIDDCLNPDHALINSPLIEAHMLGNCVMKPIGSLVLKRHLIGKQHFKRKELEGKIIQLIEEEREFNGSIATKFVQMEMDIKSGSLQAFCHKEFVPLVKSYLENELRAITTELSNELLKLEVPETKFSLFIQEGGTTKEPMMPQDFDAIGIKEPYEQEVLEEILANNIGSQIIKKYFFKEDRCVIICRSPSSAKYLLDLFQEENVLEVLELEKHQVYPLRNSKASNQMAPKSNVTVCLEFQRRLRRNFGFIKFQSGNLCSEFSRSYTILPVKSSRDRKTARIVPISPSLKEETIRRSIGPKYGKVKISLPREKPFESTQEDINLLIQELESKLIQAYHVPRLLFQIRPMNNQSHFVNWKFFIDFCCIETGVQLARDFNNRPSDLLLLHTFESCRYDINASIVTYADVYEAYREKVKKMLPDNVQFELKTKQERVVLTLKSDDHKALTVVKTQLSDILEGEMLTHDNLRYCKTPNIWEQLSNITGHNKALLKRRCLGDHVTLTLFGEPKLKSEMKTVINK